VQFHVFVADHIAHRQVAGRQSHEQMRAPRGPPLIRRSLSPPAFPNLIFTSLARSANFNSQDTLTLG
jgi:hypothetical protein